MPGLHISLGVFKKFFDLLELSCHELDKRVLLLKARANGTIGLAEFDSKIALLKRAFSHRVRAAEFQEHASTMQQTVTLLALHTDIDNESEEQVQDLLAEIKISTDKSKEEV